MASAVTGHTGALHAGAQLSHRGWIVSLTLAGAPRTDLFSQHPDDPSRLLAVQVKAEQGGGFFLDEDLAETVAADDEWFILVSLREPGSRPTFFVLPRAHVAAAVGTAKACFKSRYRQLGHRNFSDYAESWDQLLRPSSNAAWRLPRWHWDWRQEWGGGEAVGMPEQPPLDAPDV